MRGAIKHIFFFLVLTGCARPASEKTDVNTLVFPDELVRFNPSAKNPVFSGTGKDTWDKFIRERGYILREDDGYHMWYTGYRDEGGSQMLSLGYATSPDGIRWKRFEGNPVFSESWTEDMMVLKWDGTYYMFAEGKDDRAHMLLSADRIHWEDKGLLNIRYTNGQPLSEGPYGTPTVFRGEDDLWYLFYERNDDGVWLATSTDLRTWTHVQDEPVLRRGPQSYDRFGVAVNQVIRHGDYYYAYYHGTAFRDWREWSTNVAVSPDLVHWTKYPANPVMKDNKSSGILVHDGSGYNLYTMHPEVCLHVPE